MRPMIVGLWSRDTTKHSGSSTDEKIKHLKSAAAKVAAEISKQKIPSTQDVCGILIAPEYFFTKPGAGTWNGNTFNDRSLSETDMDNAARAFTEISKLYPKILLIPGSVAWKKNMIQTEAQKDLTHDKQKTGEKMGGGRYASKPLSGLLWDWITDPANASFFAANKTNFANDGISITDPNKLYSFFLRKDDLLRIVANATGNQLSTFKAHLSVIPTLDAKLSALNTATSMMRNTALALLKGRTRFKYNKHGDFHEAIGDGSKTVFIPGSHAGVCTIGAIRFGFEICLDHALGYLGRVQTTNPIASGLMREPRDIHIVTSAAVQNNTGNMYVRPGGYFLHASTNKSWTCVYHNEPPSKGLPGGLKTLTPISSGDLIDGDPLLLYRIELPNFGLSSV